MTLCGARQQSARAVVEPEPPLAPDEPLAPMLLPVLGELLALLVLGELLLPLVLGEALALGELLLPLVLGELLALGELLLLLLVLGELLLLLVLGELPIAVPDDEPVLPELEEPVVPADAVFAQSGRLLPLPDAPIVDEPPVLPEPVVLPPPVDEPLPVVPLPVVELPPVELPLEPELPELPDEVCAMARPVAVVIAMAATIVLSLLLIFIRLFLWWRLVVVGWPKRPQMGGLRTSWDARAALPPSSCAPLAAIAMPGLCRKDLPSAAGRQSAASALSISSR
jgi:hypothetical protein